VWVGRGVGGGGGGLFGDGARQKNRGLFVCSLFNDAVVGSEHIACG
jgi:hypothetical protein